LFPGGLSQLAAAGHAAWRSQRQVQPVEHEPQLLLSRQTVRNLQRRDLTVANGPDAEDPCITAEQQATLGAGQADQVPEPAARSQRARRPSMASHAKRGGEAVITGVISRGLSTATPATRCGFAPEQLYRSLAFRPHVRCLAEVSVVQSRCRKPGRRLSTMAALPAKMSSTGLTFFPDFDKRGSQS
jgi:hypothetical protein